MKSKVEIVKWIVLADHQVLGLLLLPIFSVKDTVKYGTRRVRGRFAIFSTPLNGPRPIYWSSGRPLSARTFHLVV